VVPPTTEADETAADAAVDEHTPPRKPDASITTVSTILLAIGFAVATIAFVVMLAAFIRLRHDKDSTNDDRTAVATVAAQVAEAMTAIDATGDNKTEADVVHRLGTGPLIEQYDATIPATRKLLVAVKVQSERGQITPSGVYVGDVDSDQAQVIVVIDLVVVGDVTKVVPNQYLRMHLVKLNGEWKVDNVNDVNAGLAASASGSSTTTSTPPTDATASSG
jgi:hypothetical protein